MWSKSRLQLGVVRRLRVANPEGHSHRRRDADGRRAANDHGADGVGNFLVALAGDVGLFRGQLRLIDEAHTGVRPFQGLDHFV